MRGCSASVPQTVYRISIRLVNFRIYQRTIGKLFGLHRMNLLFISFVLIAVVATAAGAYWFRAHRAATHAKARGAWLTRELERTDSRIEVAEVWSDEEIERKDRELANAILEKVGTELSADECPEALRLRTFLAKIRHGNTANELQTPRDIGIAWFACLQVQDREPATELAEAFRVLNDAWTATREGQAKISNSQQQIMLKAITTTLVQGGGQLAQSHRSVSA